MSATIVTPTRGAVVKHHGKDTWLLSDCGQQNVAYTCIAHEIDFPTKAHFAIHAKDTGEHIAVRWCPRHGLEAITPKGVPPTREPGEES